MFGQEAWEKALSLTATEEEYAVASARLQRIGGVEGIDRLLAKHQVRQKKKVPSLGCPARNCARRYIPGGYLTC